MFNVIKMFSYIKTADGAPLRYNRGVVTQSEYDKVTITYPVEKAIYETKVETKVDKVVDADGNEIILRKHEIEVPVLDDDNKPIVKEKVREMVRYNPYDGEYTIIPDDAEVITEEEYNEFLQYFKN